MEPHYSTHLATLVVSYSHFSLALIGRRLKVCEYILALQVRSWTCHKFPGAACTKRVVGCATVKLTRTCLISSNSVAPLDLMSFSVTSIISPSLSRSRLLT